MFEMIKNTKGLLYITHIKKKLILGHRFKYGIFDKLQ